jgi:hypothetical protein
MPEISRFQGIVILMYFDDHTPAHFHAVYGKHRITVEIETDSVHGSFPERALRLVLEWRSRRKNELIRDWDLARIHHPLFRIAPLE